MTNEANKPIDTLRDGAIKAVIWKNELKDGGVRFSVDLVRSYTDEQGNWKDSHYFSNGELLRVAHLASKAYDRLGKLRAEIKSDAGGSE